MVVKKIFLPNTQLKGGESSDFIIQGNNDSYIRIYQFVKTHHYQNMNRYPFALPWIVYSAENVDKSQDVFLHSINDFDLSTFPWKTPSEFPTLYTIPTTAIYRCLIFEFAIFNELEPSGKFG